MKRLIFLLLPVLLLCFTACEEKEVIPKYNMTICDSSFSQIFSALEPTISAENKVEMQNFAEINILDFIASSCDENVLSITIYSESLTLENVSGIIAFVKEKNVPVIFACQDVPTEALNVYDKAFCVTTNYVFVAESFAAKVLTLWKEGTIRDRDENKIFAFSVLKDETSPGYLSVFYENLVSMIEIYGIPVQLNEEFFPSLDEISGYLESSKASNEAFFIFSGDMLERAKAEYAPVGEGVELLSIYRGTENIYSDFTSGQVCFIDYNQYFQAVAEILANYTEHEYPLSELSFPVTDKTVYILPKI